MKKKTDFTAISINRIVAEQFRKYSRGVTSSHSETLDLMIDFFERARISPKDKFHLEDYGFRYTLTKRLNELEHIITEQGGGNQFQDMQQKLDVLLERTTSRKTSGRFGIERSVEEDAMRLVDTYKTMYEEARKEVNALEMQFGNILQEMALVKPLFGEAYYKAKFDRTRIEKLLSHFDYRPN